MATIVRAVPCHRVITDQETNGVTLVDCVETLAPKKLPARLPRLVLATLWQRTNAEANGDGTRARLRILGPDPDGPTLIEHELPPLEFKEGQKRLRVNINLQGVEITKAGVHRIVIDTAEDGESWSVAATTMFEIVEPTPEDAPLA